MPGKDYAVDLCQGDLALGAGFLLTRCFVVTADHCLKSLAPHDDRVSVEVEGGLVVEGRVRQRVPEADLALVEVCDPSALPLRLPQADLARRGDDWRGLHRPSLDDPHLGGTVDAHTVDYACEGGGRIEALQLIADQALGDYSGYSGGPVERVTPDRELAVLGILVEQYPDRQDDRRSANVLFAATIREVIDRFAHLQTGNLLKVLDQDPPPRPAAPAESQSRDIGETLAKGEALLTALKEWSSQELLDPAQLTHLQAHVAKSVIDITLRGEGDAS
ncbi:trypsin-like serine protease [Streptomyces sp. G45]|uniref:trypsin-like serine protease n=1 Tax=Streptomyces sp. G45 TaxID=3406627 RepID=UPI003C1D4B0C